MCDRRSFRPVPQEAVDDHEWVHQMMEGKKGTGMSYASLHISHRVLHEIEKWEEK